MRIFEWISADDRDPLKAPSNRAPYVSLARTSRRAYNERHDLLWQRLYEGQL